MAFPKIRHCLVCEGVREEINRKRSVLGFYGVTPDVEIMLEDFARPMGHLVFFSSGVQRREILAFHSKSSVKASRLCRELEMQR